MLNQQCDGWSPPAKLDDQKFGFPNMFWLLKLSFWAVEAHALNENTATRCWFEWIVQSYTALLLRLSLHTFLTFRKRRSITPKTRWELNKTIITANCDICWRSWQLPNIVMASFKPSDTMLRKHGCDTSVTKQKHPLIIINIFANIYIYIYTYIHHNLYVSIMINTAWCQMNKPTKTST